MKFSMQLYETLFIIIVIYQIKFKSNKYTLKRYFKNYLFLLGIFWK